MEFILYDLNLNDVTLENLQLCLEEGENYVGTISFQGTDYYKMEDIFVVARQLNEPGAPPIQDVTALKKLVIYLLCFLNKPIQDPNGEYLL